MATKRHKRHKRRRKTKQRVDSKPFCCLGLLFVPLVPFCGHSSSVFHHGSGTFSITNGTSTVTGRGPTATSFTGTPASFGKCSRNVWRIVWPSSLGKKPGPPDRF